MTHTLADPLPADVIDRACAAPFHVPLTDDQVRRYLLRPGSPLPMNGELSIGDGWVLSAFSWFTNWGRHVVWGWVKGPLAIDERYDDDDTYLSTVLTHLPSGRRVLQGTDAELMAACAEALSIDFTLSFDDLKFVGQRVVADLRNAGFVVNTDFGCIEVERQ